MTFEEFKAAQEILDNAHKAATALLVSVSGERGPMGLTADHVKNSPEWRAAYTAERKAFAAFRDFNGVYAPKFKKEIIAEIQAKREKRLTV